MASTVIVILSEALAKSGVHVSNWECRLKEKQELYQKMYGKSYDPAKDEKFPWEDDVRAAIEKLRAEKAAEEAAERQSEPSTE